jgi:comEA protein
LTTAFLLGLATTLLAIRAFDLTRWRTRPLDLERGRALAYRIDINQADQPQLLQVPGIGEKTAKKIEAYRREHGPFDRVEDLTKIPGIGPATVEKSRAWVRAGSSDFEKDGSAPPKAVQARSAAAKKALSPSQETNSCKPVSKNEETLTAPIDGNRGISQELQRFPGVDPKIEQRIGDERNKAPRSKAVQGRSAPAKKALLPSQGTNSRKPVSKKEESLTRPIDVNRAPSEELQRLPGIGPKIAQRIIDERNKRTFQSVDDLRRVSGIGPKILERLRPYVTVKRDPVSRAAAD